MLYLWPLFAFFSAPVIIPSAISILSTTYERVAGPISGTPTPLSQAQASKPVSPSPTASLQILDFLISRAFNVCFFLCATVLAVVIVKYNTIIHPFTLADNRHYMFYVFRYTILRSQTVRFALVGAYIASAYLIWSRLAGSAPTEEDSRDTKYISRPFYSSKPVKPPQATKPGKPSTASTTDTNPDVKPDDTVSASSASPPTSAALLWLGTTALSLVSAPLVEPRYFILPWIFWRLLVPSWSTPPHPPARLQALPGVGWLNSLGRRIDLTAVLETAWFVAVNLVTFWIFLSRPYQWRSVDGRILDQARWQRFMW